MKKTTAFAALLIFVLFAAASAETADLIPPFHWTYHSLSHLHEAGLINEEVVPGKSAFTPTQVASLIVLALKHAENDPEKLGDAEFSDLKQLTAAYKDSFRPAGFEYEEIRKDIEIAAMRAGLTTADDSAKADALSAEAARMVNSFTFDLYRQAASTRSGSSFFISPYSVSTALAMTYAGARGATESEMEKTLSFSPDMHESMGALISALNRVPQDVAQVSCANALWPAKEEKILPEFAQTLAEYYGAALTPLDYAGAPENSRRTVNKWVENNTNQKIKDIVPPGAFTRDTVLTLTNTIYFRSSWLEEFQPENTEPRPFWPAEDHSVNVITMRRRAGEMNYAKFPECEIVEMPYKGELFSMLVILPDRKKGIDSVEKILTEKQLSEWTSRLIPRRVEISIPKFKQESSYELSEMLSDMGMPSAFSPGADFSGINGTGDLHIDKVLHKTFVDVAEEGTEAAAATAIIMMKNAHAGAQDDLVIFRADHPFIYLIKENKSDAILFVGRYMKP
ncbi:MAG: serpin family protein [Synergistes sp.]|nr:serpin family protein [Synergistes sp.]